MVSSPNAKTPILMLFILSLVMISLNPLLHAEAEGQDIDVALRLTLTEAGVTSLEAPVADDPAKIELGRLLFFDPILNGNRDISCASCHHPTLHTADALALSIGVGGRGLGTERVADQNRARVPRNAPDLFNRGLVEWRNMFWDNRISLTATGLLTPAGEALPAGLDNLLAVQALFPVTSRDEMRGEVDNTDSLGQVNELALFADDDFTGIWQALEARLRATPSYVELFRDAYPGLEAKDIRIHHVANALAAFEAAEWTFLDSPFDLYLTGKNNALTLGAKQGALLFYGEAGCSSCHSGKLLTDQMPHNIAVPPLGPGKSGSKVDYGRGLLTNQALDRFAFRTPPLRNVSLTGPWMHNGAYSGLEDVIWHHLDPEAALRTYDVDQLEPDLQASVRRDRDLTHAILDTLDPLLSQPRVLSDQDIEHLVAFLEALTSPRALDLSGAIPSQVPSGLPFD